MTRPLFCRLYILTTVSDAVVQASIDALLQRGVAGTVYRNEDFDGRASDRQSSDFIATSQLTAEIDGDDLEGDDGVVDQFQAGVIAMVSALRSEGHGVVAACDFEERIAAETGWNWTEDTPFQPMA